MKEQLKNIKPGDALSVGGLTMARTAYLAQLIFRELDKSVVLVCDGPRTLDTLTHDLGALSEQDGQELLYYPGWENLSAKPQQRDTEIAGDRLRALVACSTEERPFIMATTIQAVMQPVVDPQRLQQGILRLSVGEEVAPETIALRIEEMGYEFLPEVQQKGECARRGGVIDVWCPDLPFPVRMEFWGDEIESIRTFDPYHQRSLSSLNDITIGPHLQQQATDELTSSIHAYLPKNAIVLLYEPEALVDHGTLYEHSVASKIPVLPVAQAMDVSMFPTVSCRLASSEQDMDLGLEPFDGLGVSFSFTVFDETVEALRQELVQRLKQQENYTIAVFLHTEGALERFQEAYFEEDHPDHIHLAVRPLSEGFVDRHRKKIMVSETDLYGTRKQTPGRYEARSVARRSAKTLGSRISDWTEIETGDLVVHIEHGIGRYQGIHHITLDNQVQEVLTVAYADDARLHVPVSQAHLLSRYIGVGKAAPRLHKLGGARWERDRQVAQKAVEDFAAGMLEMQARRKIRPGYAFSKDTHWQVAFEATFPFQETEDQWQAIQNVKRAMEDPRPMDHLICGDVGYGKTEVAMRAAFKAVMDNKQVAVLAPTTILAQQHFERFCERMATFPVTIDVLSRFRTKHQQQQIIQQLQEGKVDIVIGTHRLLQPDITFHNLGLMIIDEEQKFGVRHKERLKAFSEMVDVLTLSATPIPRTLYMSLTGVKEMSVISTPPQDRLPVKTIVKPYSDEIVRQAILQELNREGQVFFLHNRVKTIEHMRNKLQELVPEARIAVGHGQMAENELEQVIDQFINGEYDVLLCTTIIENGVDISAVNTILIDRADRFGMSDLYQLRGRVGRSKHQAYAYLLLPPDGSLMYEARQRVEALQKHASLGAGFKLALRDLEVRGAGNMLGSEQSGHITAIGFDLYCQLLERTVKQLKKEPVPPLMEVAVQLDFIDTTKTVLAHTYIPEEKTRIEVYRKLAALMDINALRDLKKELRDRFGRLPPETEQLVLLAEIRIRAVQLGLTQVEVKNRQLRLKKQKEYIKLGSQFPRLTSSTPRKKLTEILGYLRHLPEESLTPTQKVPSRFNLIEKDPLTLRRETRADYKGIFRVHKAAFPTDTEARMVGKLRTRGETLLSLLAALDGNTIAHINLSRCYIETPVNKMPAVWLEPLGVVPEHQRQGIGKRLIRYALRELHQQGEKLILLHRETDYFAQLGFGPATTFNIRFAQAQPTSLMALPLAGKKPPSGILHLPSVIGDTPR